MSKKIKITILIIIILSAAATATYFIIQQRYKDKSITDSVGEHYLLPNEQPALLTVEDKTKVESQFLRSAENGDKLLVYKDAKKVILYRPSIDKIVEVGPISIASTNEENK